MIVSVDGLTGFGDAIHAVYPQAEIQRCIVHQIRYSTKFISYKDIKPFMADLKEVYQASTEEIAHNRQLRKVTKSKTIFPTDDALFKMLYLAMMGITKKWEGKPWNWGLILEQLCIYFEGWINRNDKEQAAKSS